MFCIPKHRNLSHQSFSKAINEVNKVLMSVCVGSWHRTMIKLPEGATKLPLNKPITPWLLKYLKLQPLTSIREEAYMQKEGGKEDGEGACVMACVGT